MVRIFRDTTSALRRMETLTRQTGLSHAVLHRVFNNEHRYIVGRWVKRNGRKHFLPSA